MELPSAEEWRTLEPLLDAALDAAPAERDSYLDAVCTGDPARRARLVELLAACESGERLLLTPAESFAPLFRVPEVLGERYRILRELGHGGMATVYLADDLRHRREVAVKVLDVEAAQTIGAARFLQEIEIAARLQHPHILPLFDSGDAEGLLYYVMPSVEGESLRDRLHREGQLPVEDALLVAREVADALDFAHRHGVVHRDIKPENILLHDGRSMVADFGIAVAVRAAAAEGSSERGPLLGTPRYMSPEQASGAHTVTGQSDIYSLGVVLYEMLAGEPPLATPPQGAEGGVMAVAPVPDVIARRKSVPPNVAAAVARATEPLPADRFANAQDFARALGDPGFRHGALVGKASAAGAGRWNRTTIGVTALSIVVTATAAVVLLRDPVPSPAGRFDVTPEKGRAMLPRLSGVEFALSRDGSQIVYVGESPEGGSQLWVRSLTNLEATPIRGSDEALSPALSADGRWVAFHDRRGIRALPLAGGSSYLAAASGTNPTWGSDAQLYFAAGRSILRVPPAGGSPDTVASVADAYLDFPDALPDGRGLLVTVRHGGPGQSRIAVVGPQDRSVREILTGTMARYAAPGHIVWATAGGQLMSAPFDLKRLELTGPPVGLLDGIAVKLGSASQFAVSRAGPLVYQAASDQTEAVWATRRGGVERLEPPWTGSLAYPRLSPDGTRLALSIREGRTEKIAIRGTTGGAATNLTLEGGLASAPTWSPDGKSVTYAWNVAGDNALWTVWTRLADGSAPAVPNVTAEPGAANPQWSPDGQWLVYRIGFNNTDIMGLRSGRGAVSVALVATRARERSPAISADGRWLAYTSDESGIDEVYVRPFPNTGSAKYQVSSGGGSEPLWSRNAPELFYRNGRRELVSVPVESKSTFSMGVQKALFSAAEFETSQFGPQYDVSPDDTRFLMLRRSGSRATGRLILHLDGVRGLLQGPRD